MYEIYVAYRGIVKPVSWHIVPPEVLNGFQLN